MVAYSSSVTLNYQITSRLREIFNKIDWNKYESDVPIYPEQTEICALRGNHDTHPERFHNVCDPFRGWNYSQLSRRTGLLTHRERAAALTSRLAGLFKYGWQNTWNTEKKFKFHLKKELEENLTWCTIRHWRLDTYSGNIIRIITMATSFKKRSNEEHLDSNTTVSLNKYPILWHFSGKQINCFESLLFL